MHAADVDVVIPVYNGAPFLAAAIESALAQTLPPRCVIVVDDGSTDDSADIARRYEGGSVALRLVQKRNGGLSSARNAGLAVCRGEFVALLDADDVWLPHKLERQVQRFRASDLDQLGVVYCDYDDIDERGQALTNFPSRRLLRGLRGQIRRRIFEGNLVAGSGSAVLVRRACLEHVGGFDESLPSSEDWEMWLRLAEHYTFDYVDEVLVHLRRHGGSMQAQKVRQLLRTDLKVLARQHGDLLDRSAIFAAGVRRLAVTPGTLVRELLTSRDNEDAQLLDALSLRLPRPLYTALIYNAKALRMVRAELRKVRRG